MPLPPFSPGPTVPYTAVYSTQDRLYQSECPVNYRPFEAQPRSVISKTSNLMFPLRVVGQFLKKKEQYLKIKGFHQTLS